MIIPIRCQSCGKPIAHLYEEYKKRTADGKEEKGAVLTELGLKRHCCRAHIISNVDLLPTVAKFKKF